MNHQVGDSVTIADYAAICARTTKRISNAREFADDNSAYFVDDMKHYCGKTYTIRAERLLGYALVEIPFTWSDYMLTSFEPIDSTQPYEFW